jgi:hypothetical protein
MVIRVQVRHAPFVSGSLGQIQAEKRVPSPLSSRYPTRKDISARSEARNVGLLGYTKNGIGWRIRLGQLADPTRDKEMLQEVVRELSAEPPPKMGRVHHR